MVVEQMPKPQGVSIVLGGSSVHNTMSFVKELVQLDV
jgi:hypothetical protein